MRPVICVERGVDFLAWMDKKRGLARLFGGGSIGDEMLEAEKNSLKATESERREIHDNLIAII